MPLFTFRGAISESSGELFSVYCCTLCIYTYKWGGLQMEATFRDGAVWSQNVVVIAVAGRPWIMLCVRDVNLPPEQIQINNKQLWLQSAADASGTFHFAQLPWAP